MKGLCVGYWKLNTQLPAVLGDKTSGAITLVDIPKKEVMSARLRSLKYFTILDLRSGYYHNKQSPTHKHKKCIH